MISNRYAFNPQEPNFFLEKLMNFKEGDALELEEGVPVIVHDAQPQQENSSPLIPTIKGVIGCFKRYCLAHPKARDEPWESAFSHLSEYYKNLGEFKAAQKLSRASTLILQNLYFQEVVRSGDPEQQFQVALRYLYGKKIKKDPTKASQLLQLARDQGHARALYYLEMCKQGKEKIEDIQAAASEGEVKAQLYLGIHLLDGNGVAKDVEEAVRSLTIAAENGDPDAQFLLATCYAQGEGVVQDVREAARLYKQAADQGHVIAQLVLGRCYENGEGVLQNDKKAVECYQHAADQGNCMGQILLGHFYLHGKGVEMDRRKALELLSQVSKEDSSGTYGLAYINFADKTAQPDMGRIMSLLKVASLQGNLFARKQFELLAKIHHFRIEDF